MTKNFEIDLKSASSKILKVRKNKSKLFLSLVKSAGLNPAEDFQFRKLKSQNMSGADLSGYNFSGSDLVGSVFSNAKVGKATFVNATLDIGALSKADDWSLSLEKRIRKEAAHITEAQEDEKIAFSSTLEDTIHRALTLASDRKHELSTLEHLLLALLDDQHAVAGFKACGVDIEDLRIDVTRYLDEDLNSLIPEHFEETRPTAGFHRVIQRAVIHVQSSDLYEVTGINALIALFAERESHAVYFLQERDMTRYDIVNYHSHGIQKIKKDEIEKQLYISDADDELKLIIHSALKYMVESNNAERDEAFLLELLGSSDVKNLVKACEGHIGDLIKDLLSLKEEKSLGISIAELSRGGAAELLTSYLTQGTVLSHNTAIKLISQLTTNYAPIETIVPISEPKWDFMKVKEWSSEGKYLVSNKIEHTLEIANEIEHTMELAKEISKVAGAKKIKGHHVFFALFQSLNSDVRELLHEHNLTEESIRSHL